MIVADKKPAPPLIRYTLPTAHADPCVYFLVRGSVIVYVGITKNLPTRIEKHRENKSFDDVLYFTVPKQIVEQVERELIKELRPEYNGVFYCTKHSRKFTNGCRG